MQLSKIIYCHYMLTLFVESLWHVKFLTPLFKARRSVDRMNDQRASYDVLRISTLWYNGFMLRQRSSLLWEKPGPIRLVLIGLTASRQAGRQNTDGYWNLYNPLHVKLFGFYFARFSTKLRINSVSNTFQSAFLR